VHRQGRGFLGFSATTSAAPNGTVSRVETLTEFPYTGLARRTQASHDGVTLTDTTVSYAASATAPYLVVPTLTVTRTNDLNGAFINWTESGTAQADYDAYGNPLKLKTVYKDASGNPDGHGQDTAVTYQNDTTHWILGRPTRLAITSHAPGQPDSTRTTSSGYMEANPGLGLLKQSLTEPDNGGLAGVTNLRLATDYTYDDFGNVLTRTVSGAHVTTRTEATHTYDPQGRGPLTVQNALGHLETRVYDWRHGVASSLQGPNGLFTTWTQDAFGRPQTEDRADGTRTTTSYNPCAACMPGAVYSVNTTHTVIAGGATVAPPTRAYHDSLGRAILSAQPGFDGRYVYRETVYDNLGRVNYTAAAHFADDAVVHWTQFDHDVLGRTVKVTAPDNSLTTTAYNGRTSSNTDANGVTGSSTVNSQGKTVSIADAQGTADASSVSYEYDPWGNVSKTTDAVGNVITVTYDLLGRRTRLEDPDLGRWTYTVDNLGQLASQIDAKGQATAYTYDLLGRMTRRLEPDLDSRWVYDSATMGVGQLAEAYTLTGSGAKDYRRVHSYDALGRPAGTVATLDWDYASTPAYDAAGRLGSETHEVRAVGAGSGSGSGSGHSFSYTYNGQGYLERIGEGATVHWQVLEQDAQGRVTQGRHANGVVTRRSYHPATGRLEGIAGLHPATGQASIQNDGYAYDPVGNLRSRTQLSGSGTLQESFGYDSLNRVTSAQVAGQAQKTFSYDSIGNLASKSGVGGYTYPANGAASVRPHAVAGITGSVNGVLNPNFSYDDNGNLLSGAGRSYTWTSYDRPASISLGTGASQATDSFLHGPEHQRIRQLRAKGNPAVKQSTVYYAGAIEREVSVGGGTVTKTYLPQNLGVVQDPQAGSATTTAVRTFHHDHLGSVIALSDEAANVVERLSYDAWGLRRNPDGSDDTGTPPNQIKDGIDNKGYTGHEQLDDVRLVHMNGRVYDPVVGRFTSADPMVSDTSPSQGRNRYSYVLNNPLAFTDPTGLLEDNASSTAGTQNSGSQCSAFMAGCAVYEFGSGGPVTSGGTNTKGTFNGISLGRDAGDVRLGLSTGEKALDLGMDVLQGLYNGAITTGEVLLNAFPGFTLPGQPDYQSFDAVKIDRAYADRSVGLTAEMAGGLVVFRSLTLLKGAGEVSATEKFGICFTEGTLVHTVAGLTPIEDIREGDFVAARDEQTEELSWRPVVRLFRNADKETVRVSYVNGQWEEETLGASPEHPFRVAGRGWVGAGELKPGDRLVRRDGGSLTVRQVVRDPVRRDTFNFEVAGVHTYFVGSLGAWVHNASVVGDALEKGIGNRVEAVHGALDPIAAGRRTTAVLDTAEGTRVLAAGGRDLSPAQRALMTHGEVAAKLPGAHAEVTALRHAAQNRLTPTQMVTSRIICPSCRVAIEQSGGQLTGSKTAIWPR
jgi:RHS repeat-associated protein